MYLRGFIFLLFLIVLTSFKSYFSVQKRIDFIFSSESFILTNEEIGYFYISDTIFFKRNENSIQAFYKPRNWDGFEKVKKELTPNQIREIRKIFQFPPVQITSRCEPSYLRIYNSADALFFTDLNCKKKTFDRVVEIIKK